jgi:hypothetical protein
MRGELINLLARAVNGGECRYLVPMPIVVACERPVPQVGLQPRSNRGPLLRLRPPLTLQFKSEGLSTSTMPTILEPLVIPPKRQT